MAKLKWYLDERVVNENGEAFVKLMINQKSKTAFINSSFRVRSDQWNEESGCVVGHPHRAMMNRMLAKIMMDAEAVLQRLQEQYRLSGMSAKDIKVAIDEVLHPERQWLKMNLICLQHVSVVPWRQRKQRILVLSTDRRTAGCWHTIRMWRG